MKKLFLLTILSLFAVACHPRAGVYSSHSRDAAMVQLNPTVFFDVGKATITTPQVIEYNAHWMKRNRDKVIILEGHADERGSHDYNIELGDRRARAVMSALLQQGVAENQLIVVSLGKAKPAVQGTSEEAWSQNRRVEFKVR